MGATLSIVNNVAKPSGCTINIYTVEHGFAVNSCCVIPTQAIKLSLGRVWYDVDYQFNDGIFRMQWQVLKSFNAIFMPTCLMIQHIASGSKEIRPFA